MLLNLAQKFRVQFLELKYLEYFFDIMQNAIECLLIKSLYAF